MSGLQQKLYNYERTPPEGVWDRIAASLDESHDNDEFPQVLYNTEASPPPSAWEKITSALDQEHAAVIPMPRRSFPLFRYIAAAVIIAVISFGIIKLTGSKKEDTTEKTAAVTPKKDRSTEKTANPAEDITALKDNDDSVSSEEENPIAKSTENKAVAAKKTKKMFAAIDDSGTEPVYAYNEHSPQRLADRYIMLLTPNGVIRMSKKLGDLVCCVSGQEQDEDCKDQLKKWQEKIASSPVTPSPGNFMDILNLVSSLNENEL